MPPCPSSGWKFDQCSKLVPYVLNRVNSNWVGWFYCNITCKATGEKQENSNSVSNRPSYHITWEYFSENNVGYFSHFVK